MRLMQKSNALNKKDNYFEFQLIDTDRFLVTGPYNAFTELRKNMIKVTNNLSLNRVSVFCVYIYLTKNGNICLLTTTTLITPCNL